MLQRTRIPLDTWISAIASDERTASALSRRYRITPESARHLLRRLAAAEAALPVADPSAPATATVTGGADPASGLARAGSDAAARARLAALLALPSGTAAQVRRRSPSRRRPRPQAGPSADYGD